jgi:hypothetical protein
MRYKKAYDNMTSCLNTINGIFIDAKRNHILHKDIIPKISSRVFDTLAYKTTPQWRVSYISGYIDAMYQEIWHNHVEWRILYNGKYINSKKVPKTRWHMCNKGGAHFWIGTENMYTENDSINA